MKGKRRREEPAVRRSQILEAAKKSFRVHGLRATTVDMIATEAGVSVGLLYRFFKSKTEMVETIIVEDVQLQIEQVALALQDHLSSREQLLKLIAARLAESSLDAERLALMFEIAAEICRNPALAQFVREKRVELRSELAVRLGAGGLDGGQVSLLIQDVERASSIATGLAVHALIYSDSPDNLPAALARIGEFVVRSDV